MILTNFYFGISKAVTKDPVPKLWGFAPLVVLSGSMEPAIYPGDLVVIRAQRAERYKIGDIVTYLDGQTVFTHRIVAVEEGLYILKGDNNNTVDDAIGPEKFEGKVLFIIPKIGLAIVFLKKPAGMASLALLILIYFFFEDYFIRAKKVKRRKKGERGEDE